jgi:hypothetical protein
MTAIVLAVVLSFSVLVTVHVIGSVALGRRRSYWNAAVALVFPPFFPYYAIRSRATGWAVAWCVAALAYAAALGVALSWR